MQPSLGPTAGAGVCCRCMQGARPHYCINQAVIRKGNIDAECEELLKDGMGCKYKKNVNMLSHRQVQVRTAMPVLPHVAAATASQCSGPLPCTCHGLGLLQGCYMQIHQGRASRNAVGTADLVLWMVLPLRCTTSRTWQRLANATRPAPTLSPATWQTLLSWSSAPTATCWTPTSGGLQGCGSRHS